MSSVCVATAAGAPSINSVSLDTASGTFTVDGTNLAGATGAQLSGGSISATLAVQAGATATHLVARAATALVLTAGQAYNLVVSTASATSNSVSITYDIPLGYVKANMLDPTILQSYLPTAGGSISGALTVTGDLTFGGAAHFSTPAITGMSTQSPPNLVAGFPGSLDGVACDIDHPGSVRVAALTNAADSTGYDVDALCWCSLTDSAYEWTCIYGPDHG